MAKLTYIIKINISKKIQVNVKKDSAKEARESAVAALRDQLKDS
jgi:hypothetical protein